MASKDPSLKDVLARFDAWLDASPSRAKLLAPGVNEAAVAKLEKTLGTKLPAALRVLYKWHDGETESGGLFDAMCKDDHATEWESYSTHEPEIRFMSLDEVGKAGTFEAWFDEDTGACMRGESDPADDIARTTLVPFLWMRGKETAAADEDGDPLGPLDDDWLVALDTLHEAVFLFEIADEGLEGVLEEAVSLASWLDSRVKKLEKEEVMIDEAPESGPASTQGKPRPPAELLLQFLLDRKLMEIAEGSSLGDIAVRVAPLLSLKPEKRAIKEVITFFEEDDGVDEVFADDEMLKAIVAEFLD